MKIRKSFNGTEWANYLLLCIGSNFAVWALILTFPKIWQDPNDVPVHKQIFIFVIINVLLFLKITSLLLRHFKLGDASASLDIPALEKHFLLQFTRRIVFTIIIAIICWLILLWLPGWHTPFVAVLMAFITGTLITYYVGGILTERRQRRKESGSKKEEQE